MSLSSGDTQRLQAWLETQSANGDTLTPGLCEYILSSLESALASNDIASPQLNAAVESQLSEFLENDTQSLVARLIDQLRYGGAAAPATNPAAATIPVPATSAASNEEEVDYEDHAYEIEAHPQTTATAAAAATVTSTESIQMEDEQQQQQHQDTHKRKRATDEEEEDADNGPSSVSQAGDPHASKRQRGDNNRAITTNSASGSGNSNFSRPKKPCFDFQRRGTCQRGAACHFEHVPRTVMNNASQQQLNHPMQQQQFVQRGGMMPIQNPAQFGQSFVAPQQQWQMQQQQQMTMQQMAMQQQYMMQQQQQQQQPQSMQSDDTEIPLTGPKAHQTQHRAPAPRVGLGFHGAVASSTSGAPPAFVRSAESTMNAAPREENRESSHTAHHSDSQEETKQSDATNNEENEEDEGRHHQPTGAGAAIPFTYAPSLPMRGGRGGGRMRGGGRGGFSSSDSHSHSSNGGSSTSTKLFVSNIPAASCSLVALSPHFSEFGTITSLKVMPPSNALVEMSSHAEASAALASEKAVLGNRFIQVEWARESGSHSTAGMHHPSSKPHTKPTRPHVHTALPTTTLNPLAPPATALSALEVAKAMMAAKAESAAAAAAAAASSTAPTAAPAPVVSLTSPTPSPRSAASSAELASLKLKLQAQIQQKQAKALAATNAIAASPTNAAAVASSISASAHVPSSAPTTTTTTAPAPKMSAVEVAAMLKAKLAAKANASTTTAATTEVKEQGTATN